jgi:hypothetical protein
MVVHRGVEPATLTDVEHALVEAVVRGQVLDLAAAGEVLNDRVPRCWGADRTIRACVVRDILRGRLAPDVDPRGLRVHGAQISGRLDLDNLCSSVPLELDGCLLTDGISVRLADLVSLSVRRCRLGHPTHPAVDAERLVSRHGLSLARSVIVARCPEGAVRLVGAQLGQLDCAMARLVNYRGPALDATDLRVDRRVVLSNGFCATGTGPNGAVKLTVARIGGQFDCTGARLCNDSGPALHAAGMRIERGAWLTWLEAIGAGEDGALRLNSSQIYRLDCTGATLHTETGPALRAPGLQVTRDMSLSGVTTTGSGTGPVVDLRQAQIGGSLRIGGIELTHTTNPQARLAIDGLTYTGLPVGMDPAEWLHLLRDATATYAAQPYQQLAAGHRAAGHDTQARRVLISQRVDQLRRQELLSRPERAWTRLTGLTLGYGYQPWRALLFLLAVTCTAVTMALAAGAHGALAHPSSPASRLCSTVEEIGVGLNVALPLVKTALDDQCHPTSSATGQAFNAGSWTLQLLGWAFATLFVAGFTSIIRRT